MLGGIIGGIQKNHSKQGYDIEVLLNGIIRGIHWSDIKSCVSLGNRISHWTPDSL